ncbi:hypothetical protein CB1_001616047 [Camelus ferus]|nr:hypothetical protein CB1_001616047 [Camelus ferus]
MAGTCSAFPTGISMGDLRDGVGQDVHPDPVDLGWNLRRVTTPLPSGQINHCSSFRPEAGVGAGLALQSAIDHKQHMLELRTGGSWAKRGPTRSMTPPCVTCKLHRSVCSGDIVE